jgi:hypothetical protein
MAGGQYHSLNNGRGSQSGLNQRRGYFLIKVTQNGDTVEENKNQTDDRHDLDSYNRRSIQIFRLEGTAAGSLTSLVHSECGPV